MNSDEEYRLKWWLRHYIDAGKDLCLKVQKILEGDEMALQMLKAQLPAFYELFSMELTGVTKDDRTEEE